MTRWCSSNWSMPCRWCAAVAVGPDAGRTSCMPTRAMTLPVAAPTCASWASGRVLPGAASSAMIGLGVIAGWSSARTPGWLHSASCGLASSAASTFMSRCFLWLAASSAFAISHRFVSRSYCTRLGITVKCLLRDNSAAFRLRDFRAACLELGIKHSFTRPYRPQVNDKADRFSPHYASGHAAGRTRTPLNERTPWPAGNTITTGIVRTAASKASLPCPPPIRQERIF